MCRRRILSTVIVSVAVLSAGCGTGRRSTAATGLLSARVTMAGDSYRYWVYVPPAAARRMPLVVVLHGCSTTPAQQNVISRYDPLANRQRFAVLYPDVDAEDAAQGGCWKGIWEPQAEGRGRGDAAAIAEMTKSAVSRWLIDPARVYAIGISAGAFEASILGAAYPDLYAAIGIHSGAAYMAGQGCISGRTSDTGQLARRAVAAMGSRARPMPVIVIHGNSDHVVPYACGAQAVAQWLLADQLILRRVHRAVSAPIRTIWRSAVPHGHTYTVTSYATRPGCPLVQLWTIRGMDHFWSGGSTARALTRYSDPRGPSAAAASWAFFSRWRLTGSSAACS